MFSYLYHALQAVEAWPQLGTEGAVVSWIAAESECGLECVF